MKTSNHRPTKAIVDLAAIQFNIKQIAAHIPDNVEKWAVVKADAYGHGAVAVTQSIEPIVDGFCVSNIDEAVELRDAGITKKILVLGVSDVHAISLAIERKVTCTVASLEWIDLLLQSNIDVAGLAVHIKIDSGMGRIGFRDSQDAQEAIHRLEKAGAQVEGIFTHFATADARNKEFENLQTHRFSEMVDKVKAMGVNIEYIHCSNSAEILDCDEKYDMVRPGIIQYGIYPSNEVSYSIDIKPVMTFKAKVSNVKVLDAGTSISYGRIYFTTVREKIISIAAGYADGFLRGRRNPYVYINGVKCSIVGRICMDQCMVRVPMDMDVKVNDDVVIFGDDLVSVDDVARGCDTIAHEVMCMMSRRVPRVYYRHGEIVSIVDYL